MNPSLAQRHRSRAGRGLLQPGRGGRGGGQPAGRGRAASVLPAVDCGGGGGAGGVAAVAPGGRLHPPGRVQLRQQRRRPVRQPRPARRRRRPERQVRGRRRAVQVVGGRRGHVRGGGGGRGAAAGAVWAGRASAEVGRCRAGAWGGR